MNKVNIEHFEKVQERFIEKLNTHTTKISTIGDVDTFLKKHQNIEPKFVNNLPLYNDEKCFLLSSKLSGRLGGNLFSLWKEFIQLYLLKLSETRSSLKEELLNKDNTLKLDTETKKFIFLEHNSFHISDITIQMFIKLTHMNVLSRNKSYQIHRQNMYIGFLFYLHSKNLLLFPLDDIYNVYHRNKKAQTELDMFINDNIIYQKYIEAEKQNRLNTKEIKEKRRFLFFLYTLSPKIEISNIENNIVDSLRNYHQQSHRLIKRLFLKLGANISLEDQDVKYSKKYNAYINNNKYPELIKIFNRYMHHKVALRETNTPKEFYRTKSSTFVAFFKFLDMEHPSLKITINNLKKIFNYPDYKFTYQAYVDKLLNQKGTPLVGTTKNSRLTTLLEAFSMAEGYENVLHSRTLIRYNTKSSSSFREAIAEEIIFKLDDIVSNRPPKSDYFRNHRVDIDTSWWEHMENVRPFEPLIIKLHLRIPARGETLRLIDRDEVLVLNHKNKITGFRFHSDKNKKRKEPFIVPNIWTNELNFLTHLIEYNKHFFPHLDKFYPDDTTLKKGIIPLFPNDDGTAAYKSSQHLIYWAKVLLQAEIEFIQEGNPQGLVIATTIPIPKSIQEMETLTQTELSTFKKKYDIHTLRHTGISRYINMNMPLELVRMLSGHSGFNTILTVYHHINHEKMIQEWSKKQGVDFADALNIHARSDLFIKKKLLQDIDANEPEKLLEYLKEAGFFNLENRSIGKHTGITLETISKTDPLFWRAAHNHCGICTKSQCPQEFDGKCNLCPYFITNYLYMEEIGLQLQLSMARCKKLSDLVVLNREKREQEKNRELKTRLNLEIEGFIGWGEVLALANTIYENNLAPQEIKINDTKLPEPISYEAENTIFTLLPSLNLDHGYLDILSKAFAKDKLDDETVQDLIKEISSKIIRYTARNNTFNEIERLSDTEIIQWFLPRYEKLSHDWHTNEKSKTSLLELLRILSPTDKHLLQGTKNENTLLSK